MKIRTFFIFLVFYYSSLNNIYSLENKILFKIENEIITSIDIENEKNYLKALNPNVNDLDNDRLSTISQNSLLREKIKEKEILRYTEQIKLDKEFLDRLIKQRYSRLNLSNKEQFINYIKNYEIDIETIEKKISIEALWNQLIYQKFSKKIKINQEELLKEIKSKFAEDEKNLLLSEIVFKIENKNNLNEKYSEIINTIEKENFESAALIYSISDSSAVGGKLGWIKESSLNNSIKDKLNNLREGEITQPIFTPNGYLVLKVDEIKFIKKNYDQKSELNELIKLKTNQQLNQYSIIYFNKIKKNTNINEL